MGGRKTPEQCRRWEAANPPLHTRVDPETKAEVLEFATRHKISQAAAIRQLVEIGLEEMKQ